MITTTNLFATADIISIYTRAQAIEDGVLVDVSTVAREAGIHLPVAVSRALWADIERIPARFQGWQDVNGRLWDILFMGRGAIRHLCNRAAAGEELSLRAGYQLIMHVGRRTYYTVKVVLSYGNDGSPVLTFMQASESE